MRDALRRRVRDDEDPKKPKPVREQRARRTTNIEAAEAEPEPWSHLRKDGERDHHRHL